MKMCTQGAAIKHIKANDPNTTVTAWNMRKMVLAGQIPSVRKGHKILIDLDTLGQYLPTAKEPPAAKDIRIDKTARDEIFMKYQSILLGCVKRNIPLISALQLEVEDVMQDLSIRMLQAIVEKQNDICVPKKIPLDSKNWINHLTELNTHIAKYCETVLELLKKTSGIYNTEREFGG